jgi:riboflavin kinase/FMN adenylyltransferase
VVALGVFDGVHRGHRKILQAAVHKARSVKGTAMVVTFWPDPHREKSLYSLEHRLRLIESMGIDICIVIKFNRQFSRILAEDFIKYTLIKKIGARYIYVGRNFRFGRGAKGNFLLLESLSYIYNYRLKIFAVVKIDNKPISSTYIRKLITKGNLDAAARLLARPVSVLGTVIKGTTLGRKLGFPTANINPHHEVLPPSGVYAVKIILNQRNLKGLCYIGTKPTFLPRRILKRDSKKHVEAYIFNFKKNIYAKFLEIQFFKKIREEKRFASSQFLVKQIKKDIMLARRLFFLPISYHKICPS